MGVSYLDKVNQSFVKLTPKYIDALCTNCYECIKYSEIDKHSLVCQGSADHGLKQHMPSPSPITRDASSQDGIPIQQSNDEEEDINGRIFKLTKAIKAKLIELSKVLNEEEIKFYSSLHALSYKIFENNKDPNDLYILQQLIQEQMGDLLKDTEKLNGRRIQLQIFANRLMRLNQEKQNQLSKFLMQEFDYSGKQLP